MLIIPRSLRSRGEATIPVDREGSSTMAFSVVRAFERIFGLEPMPAPARVKAPRGAPGGKTQPYGGKR